ncbi:hypothetical protein GGI04_002932 [Coemansia thaxteri]|uniref:Thioredoxin domain-containing protein n=1 Tax=Coemansia thaxteri TaxID=2663907 RepID=A0A9W8BHE1_9FUNG|nr:hypothetical protein H4R26_003772 [Coemansia thaxteri]KAJ2003534.1 hypothetical protein GGI04_002932 [Coemansia thaxteri]KAJ2470617.1 hypothetical protein GGI02_002808 [Coemansia sp. RSA 2322]KAJ2481334.1 hypothetical protein EV174_003503 [Coemansia sp. RSA 2320]
MNDKIKAVARNVLKEGDDALSDDELLADFENDPELEKLREARLDQLKREMNQTRELRSRGHGEYTELHKEEDMVKLVGGEGRGVAHFTHPQFARCKIVDRHLRILAPHHFETRFASIDVERCPFLAQKFQIRVLPCLLLIVNGRVIDKIVGFEELGNSDTFSTNTLERRLAKCEVIKPPKGDLARIPVAERPIAYQFGNRGDACDVDNDDDFKDLE